MSNYYTPELEEFYVGFEFEAEVDSSMYRVEKGTWNKIVMNQMMMEDLLLKDKLWNNVRVKYLDREDIESLGGELLKTGIALLRESGEMHSYKLSTLLIHYSPYTHRCIIQDGPNQEVTLFWGTIKNKSELKKLLKQLGI